IGFAPGRLASSQLDTAQFRLLRVPAARAIDVSVNVYGRHPVALHGLVQTPFGIRPNDVRRAGFDFQQGASGTIGLREKDAIADDQRIDGIDALEDTGPPGELKINLAARRLESDQPPAGKYETPAPVVDGRQNRAGIARQLIGNAVADFAGFLVECDN